MYRSFLRNREKAVSTNRLCCAWCTPLEPTSECASLTGSHAADAEMSRDVRMCAKPFACSVLTCHLRADFLESPSVFQCMFSSDHAYIACPAFA